MSTSIVWYLREFARLEWLKKFLLVKTAPYLSPAYFRDFPALTGAVCTHCLQCMMICPTPGAIEVLKTGDQWEPKVHPGHCIRCGLCVEICPEDVLSAGRILEMQRRDHTLYRAEFHIHVDPALCMKCGNCVVACPVNKEIDPEIAFGGHSSTREVIMRIEGGCHNILHAEKTTGCKTCENTCPNGAMRVERIVESIHGEKESCSST
jgi:energy-converting hydrogenase A subunit P